jgi:hypothetical protein
MVIRLLRERKPRRTRNPAPADTFAVKEDCSMTNRRKEDPHVVGQTPVSGFATVEGKADEPITERQAVILRDLAERAGEPFDGNLTRGQAEERIEVLRKELGE